MSDILKDFSAPALVSAIEANQLEFWADLARFPQVELHQDREIMWFTPHGLVHAGDDVGMALDLLALNEDLPPPPALRIESVSDVVTLKQWFRAFSLSFELPAFVGQAIFDIEVSSDTWQYLPRRYYIGLLNGEPVATTMLFLGAGVAGVYSIGVLPAARRQGIGMAMTLAPLCEARAMGYRIGILHSSQMGLGMYRRLGFQEYCSVSDYIWAGETS